MFSKHAGDLSHGVEIHMTHKQSFAPVTTGLHIVKAIHDLYPEDFQFRAENSAGISFFDNLIGNGWVREAIETVNPLKTFKPSGKKDLTSLKKSANNIYYINRMETNPLLADSSLCILLNKV